MRISEHFAVDELNRSASFPELVQPVETWPPEIVFNVARLVFVTLEPVRRFYGKPLVVTSGLRSRRLNAAISGSSSSRHLEGLAADFYLDGVPAAKVFLDAARHALRSVAKVEFDRLALYPQEGRLHADLRPFQEGDSRGKLYVARPKWSELDDGEAATLAEQELA